MIYRHISDRVKMVCDRNKRIKNQDITVCGHVSRSFISPSPWQAGNNCWILQNIEGGINGDVFSIGLGYWTQARLQGLDQSRGSPVLIVPLLYALGRWLFWERSSGHDGGWAHQLYLLVDDPIPSGHTFAPWSSSSVPPRCQCAGPPGFFSLPLFSLWCFSCPSGRMVSLSASECPSSQRQGEHYISFFLWRNLRNPVI